MSDCESDLTIDLKNDDLTQKDYSFPSTSSESKSGFIEKYDSKDLAEEMDSSVSENNEDSDSESGEHCAICLSLIRGKIGSPDAEGCEHYFCLLCILEWTKNNPTCPQDRRPFKRILVRENICGEIVSTLDAEKSNVEEEEQEQADLTYCEVCGSSDREDCLLLCDGCDLGFHLECLSPPLLEVPIEEWFCPLCVAADLPVVVKKAEIQKKNEKESKTQRKKKKKPLRKPRMIPRTRASERVLRRINKTRFKESKNTSKNGGDDRKSKLVVHLFKKARPFGSIADDDIDANFNQDEYADILLSTPSPSLSNNDKKEIASKTLTDTCSNPLPSYSGRSSHPKVENYQAPDANTDILINILEEQDILLSKTKDVSLTKERKLIKKEGAKSLEFNADRENRIMSDLLPSQKKALESKGKDDKSEKENSHSRDSRNKKSEEKSRNSKDNFSNGHSSSYKRSYTSPRKSRERDSYSSHKSSKSHRSYDKKLDRRYDHDYRKRDTRRHRERSRSKERKDYSNFSGDYYDRRRSRRSRSKSRERRRTERRHNRRSRTPERHKNKEKIRKDRLPASSFWGKDYVNTFTDFDSKSNFDSYNDNLSLHTTEVSSTPQKIDVHLSDASIKSEEFLEKKSNFIEEKRKLEEIDYCSNIETETKKRRIKNLFGDEGSDQDSPIHHLNQRDVSTHSIESTKENKKDLLPKEPSRQNSVLESNSFENSKNISSPGYLPKFISDHEQDILPVNIPAPICLTSPSQSCENEQDGLGDITTLSKSSRDFIMKSLFGNHEIQSHEKGSLTSTKTENKDSIININNQDAAEHEKQKSNINDKNNDNTREKLNVNVSSESPSIEVKKNTNNKTSKMFAHLFGDSSDSEASNSPLDKNSKSPFDKNFNSALDKSSKSPLDKNLSSIFDKISKSSLDRNINSALDKSLNSAIDKNLNSTLDKNLKSLLDKSLNSDTDKSSKSPLDKNLSSIFDKISKSPLDRNINSSLDKNLKSPLDKSLNLATDKSSKSPLDKNFSSFFDKISKSPLDRDINSALEKNLKSPLDKSLNLALDKNSKSPLDKDLNSALDKNFISALDKNLKSSSVKKISEQQETVEISKDMQNGSEPKLLPQKLDIQEKPNRLIGNEIEKKEKSEKTNSEGTQAIDPKSSALSNKIKVNKLHLEMKVVEETKKFLNPFYLEKGFSKQIYKEIVSKCVSKVLESRVWQHCRSKENSKTR
ncbi:PHD and RING finger domain-containing protein 1 [Armadillidium vulgare]|nr:PHD and RING finger domain-containing protein 1 [Armadillidium vulgare]